MNDDVVAQQTYLGATFDLALGDLAARDLADLRNVEDLLDRRVAEEHLALRRSEKTRHRRFHFIDEIVDDVVVADFDALVIGRLLRLRIGADVEADDDSLRCRRKRDIRLGDATDARMHEARFDFVVADLAKCSRDRFDRTLHVALDDKREFLALGVLELLHHLLERALRACRTQRLAALADAIIRQLARTRFVLDDGELIARFRSGVEAQHLDRHRRPSRIDIRAVIVEQRSDAAPSRTGDDDIADMQRAALNENRADGTTSALELRFDDDTFRGARRVRLEVEDFGLQVDGFKQLVEVRPLQRRHRHFERFATHAFDNDFLRQEIGAHAIGIGLRLVDLVDRNDDRNLRGLGVIDRLDRLRHDAVVGRNDQNDDVRHLGAARTHGGERFVARRIDERDLVAVRGFDLIRADMLRDAAGFARDDIRGPDRIEQRRLAVVDVTHDRDDGSTRLERSIVGIDIADETDFDVGFRDALRRMAEFLHDEFRRVGVEHIGDFMHRALLHQILDEIDGALRHAVRQFLDRDRFRNDDLASDFLARLLNAHGLQLFLLALALQRRE